MKGEKTVDSTSPISGIGLENVAITGEGIIDGGGDAWRPVKKEKIPDPDWKALVASGGVVDPRGQHVVARQRCDGRRKNWSPCCKKQIAWIRKPMSRPTNICVRKWFGSSAVTKFCSRASPFENPPNWTLNPAFCEDVTIQNVSVHNSYAAQNSDALDVESCRRVIVRDCTIDTGDDGICLKSGKDAAGRRIGVPDEDILIEGCTVYHAHGGFVIGSEMSGGVHNIYVDNCTFIGTDNGLRFKSARGRGGVVENIFISNVRMENILGNAIDFEMFYETRSGKSAARNSPKVDAGTPQFPGHPYRKSRFAAARIRPWSWKDCRRCRSGIVFSKMSTSARSWALLYSMPTPSASTMSISTSLSEKN